MTKENLIEMAKDAMDYSYSPYSKFKVGAALLTKDGDVYLGANIENAAYGATMCAERNAIYNAYCHGIQFEDIEAIAIVADCPRPVSPCGICRQVMSELLPPDTPVYLANLDGEVKETSVEELLPYGFVSEDLNQ